MHANSSAVSSNQPHLHPRLAAVVRRHLGATHRARILSHNLSAYESLRQKLAAEARPLVLDSFCGTGHSTAALAERHPGHLVVGIDKSAQRLAKHPFPNSDNYLLLRADCEDIWQLLARDGMRADFHYMLYPNPCSGASTGTPASHCCCSLGVGWSCVPTGNSTSRSLASLCTSQAVAGASASSSTPSPT